MGTAAMPSEKVAYGACLRGPLPLMCGIILSFPRERTARLPPRKGRCYVVVATVLTIPRSPHLPCIFLYTSEDEKSVQNKRPTWRRPCAVGRPNGGDQKQSASSRTKGSQGVHETPNAVPNGKPLVWAGVDTSSTPGTSRSFEVMEDRRYKMSAV